MRIILNLIMTFFVVTIGGIVKTVFNSASTIVVGNVAGSQFDASNASALVTSAVFSTSSALDMIVYLVVPLLIILIWYPMIRDGFKTLLNGDLM